MEVYETTFGISRVLYIDFFGVESRFSYTLWNKLDTKSNSALYVPVNDNASVMMFFRNDEMHHVLVRVGNKRYHLEGQSFEMIHLIVKSLQARA